MVFFFFFFSFSVFFSPLLLSGSDDPELLSNDEDDEEVARGRPFHQPESPEQESFLKKHFETLADTNDTGSDDFKIYILSMHV